MSETQRRRSGVFIDNFEQISHPFLVFLLLNLNRQIFAGILLPPISTNLWFSLKLLHLIFV